MGLNLWQQFLNDDENAFSELYQYYYNEMLSYGLKIGFDRNSVEDAVQDVFIKILLSKNKLSYVKNIEFYLLNSLRNRLFDFHNKERKVQKLSHEEAVFDGDDSIIEAIIKNENEKQLVQEIRESLKHISAKQRKIIHFHYKLNLSFNEIATIFDSSPEAVRKSFNRALKKIKKDSSGNLKSFRSIFLTILC